MLVSVVIPVYNGERFLYECLESVRACPSPEMECIIVNDGSEDGTEELCLQFLREDARFRLINKENSGISDSRNRGMAQAIGDYVFFLDADDYIDVGRWPEILTHAADGAADMAAFGYYDLFTSGQVKKEPFPEGNDLRSVLLSTTLLNTCWGKLFRREIISDSGLKFRKELRTCEDAIFVLDFIRNAKNIMLLDCCALYYRIHPGGVMRSTSLEDKLSDFVPLLESRRAYLSENYDESLRVAMYRQSFSVITDLFRTNAGIRRLPEARDDFRKSLKNPVIKEIMAQCGIKSLSPIYKKFEFGLLSMGLCACLAVYFKLKGRFTSGVKQR